MLNWFLRGDFLSPSNKAEDVGVFVFVFTPVELYVFRRYDFMSMYAFRLVFYMWWHVTWGYLRLRWLF
jgi:hypothetical protein